MPSDTPKDHLECSFECDCPPVTAETIRSIQMILNDPKTPMLAKQLASITMSLAEAHNELIRRLETGSVTLKIEEKNISFPNRSH